MTTSTAPENKLIDLIYARRLSPPSHLTLRPAHLPAPCADAFAAVRDALAAERTAQEAADKARGSKPEQAEADAARAVTDQALQDFAEVTAASSSAIADSAQAAFEDALGVALLAIREAEARLEEAQHARALRLRVQPGRPITHLGLDSRTLRDDPRWQQLSGVRQALRDAAESVQGLAL
ncbi:hypothetical protein [Kitasatospora terrestris]|uniref:Uncharacterized protein n=1 Tax=Kitasatospora terrestris TaxID=258051 RepID=A0ABP9E4T1_9ACTN